MHIIIRQNKEADHSGGPLDDSVLCPQLPQLSESGIQCYIKNINQYQSQFIASSQKVQSLDVLTLLALSLKS